ncbi:hypothetical protein L1887_28321 [Cichorium endivia]|nr:hypothetical protein L1887_28321 [Cichorium endivia]
MSCLFTRTLHYVICPRTTLEWSPSTCPTTNFLWTHTSSNLILSPTFSISTLLIAPFLQLSSTVPHNPVTTSPAISLLSQYNLQDQPLKTEPFLQPPFPSLNSVRTKRI